MRLDTSGNLGIGVTPTATLQVYNATSALIQVDGDVASNIRATRYSTDTNAPSLQARKARGTFASPTAVASGDTVGNFLISAYGGTNYRSVGQISAVVDTYTSDTNISSYLTFSTNGGSTAVTERMRIDSSGRVGINVTPSTATAAKLQVTGGTTNATTLATSFSNAATVIYPKSSSGYSLNIASGTGDLPQLQVTAATGSVSGDLLLQPYGGSVGIGTSAPSTYSAKLAVYSDASSVANIQITNPGVGTGTIGLAAASSNFKIYNSFASGTLASGAGIDIDTSGNVGIGTGSPAAKLDVVGISAGASVGARVLNNDSGATSSAQLSAVTAGGVSAAIYAYGTSAGYLGTVSNHPSVFITNNTERMRIDSSGNVSIATGNLTFSATSQRITGDFSNATTASRVAFQTSTANSNTSLLVLPSGTATIGGADLFNNSDPTNAAYASIQARSTEVRLQSAITGTGTYLPITFYTGGSERVRIDTSGNVGIGGSPFAYGAGYTDLWVQASTSPVIDLAVSTTRTGTFYASSSAVTFGSIAAVPLITYTANTERMRIDSSGNVQIGTTTADGQVHIKAATGQSVPLTLTTTDAASNTQVAFKGSRTYQIGTGNASSGFAGSLFFYDGTAAATRMLIDSSGNVGIGTTSPTSLLHVSSTTANPQIKITDLSIAGGRGGSIQGSYGGNGLYLDSLAASGWVYIGSSTGGGQATNIRFDTSSTERMRIDSSGNVGIGTSSPAVKLDVAGGINATSNIVTGNGAAFVFGTATTAYMSGSSTSNNLTYFTASTERMRIDSVGNTYIETGNLWQYAPAPTSKAAAATLTAAELLTGILNTTGTSYTVTVPTGTAIDAGWTGVPTTNIGFEFVVINTASGTITMAVNTNVTSLGTLTIATGVSARFRFRRTAANTYVMYRIG